MNTRRTKTLSGLAFFLELFRQERARYLCVFALVAFCCAAACLSPWLQRFAIDAIQSGNLERIVVFSLCAAVAFGAWRTGENMRSFLTAQLYIRLERTMKRRVFRHLLELPLSLLRIDGAGYYAGRFQTDVEAMLRHYASGIFNLANHGTKIVCGLCVCAAADWRFGILLPLIVLIDVLLTLRFRRRQYKLSVRILENRAAAAQTAQNLLGKSKLVKTDALGELAGARYADDMDRLADLRMKRLWRETLFRSCMRGIPAVCFLALYVLGVRNILRDQWTLGMLWSMFGYLFLILNPLQAFCSGLLAMQESAAASKRLQELFRHLPENVASGKRVDAVRGDLEFRDVVFSYGGGRKILDGASFSVAAGEFVGLAGESGAGKSTVAALILRLCDPASGEILLDGVPLRDFELKGLRARIGFIGQNVEFFHASLRENLSVGQDFSNERLHEVLREVGMEERVRRDPKGLDLPIYEDQGNFSGGELLRLALARELLRNPAVCIFDEITANLDPETEASVMDLLRRRLAGRTVLLVSHRTSTLRKTDRVLTLANGRIRSG